MFGRRRKTALSDELVFTEGILRTRGVRRCSTAPIAKLARMGEPQFSQWRYGEPVSASREPELDTWELPFSVALQGFNGTPAALNRFRPRPACPSPQTRPTSPTPPARRGYDARARRARLIS